MRKDKNRVRITAQLIDVATGSHIFSPALRPRACGCIRGAGQGRGSIVRGHRAAGLCQAEDVHARRRAPENLDAWELVMRAMSPFFTRWPGTTTLPRQKLLEQAIAIDPNYAQARAVLAVSRTFGARMGWEDSRLQPSSPSAPGCQRSAPTARIPGRISRSARRIRISAGSRMHWPAMRPRSTSIRASRWRMAITPWCCPGTGASVKARKPRVAR